MFAVKTIDFGSYLKVFIGIKKKIIIIKKFFGLEKIYVLIFFFKIGWNYYIKIRLNRPSSFSRDF